GVGAFGRGLGRRRARRRTLRRGHRLVLRRRVDVPHRRDASKAALAHLVGLFDGAAGTGDDEDTDTADSATGEWLIDTQWQTSHLRSLGVSEISGLEYSARLDSALRGDLCQGILNK